MEYPRHSVVRLDLHQPVVMPQQSCRGHCLLSDGAVFLRSGKWVYVVLNVGVCFVL